MVSFAKDMVKEISDIFVDHEKRFQRELQECDTNMQRVALIRKNYPDTKAIRISEELGISRERVRQLLVELDLPTSFEIEPMPNCKHCGVQLLYRLKEQSTGLCKDCFMASKRIVVVCFQCRQSFILRKTDYDMRKRRGYQHTFCGQRCKGAYLGKTYGFLAYPENMCYRIEAEKNVN